jgi:hypothetical protein
MSSRLSIIHQLLSNKSERDPTPTGVGNFCAIKTIRRYPLRRRTRGLLPMRSDTLEALTEQNAHDADESTQWQRQMDVDDCGTLYPV